MEEVRDEAEVFGVQRWLQHLSCSVRAVQGLEVKGAGFGEKRTFITNVSHNKRTFLAEAHSRSSRPSRLGLNVVRSEPPLRSSVLDTPPPPRAVAH